MDFRTQLFAPNMTNTARLVLALACLTGGGCAPNVYGRVVSDVRVADGYISVDRCVLKQRAYHQVAVSDCKTENYYIGKAVVPIQSTTSAWQQQ